MKQNLSSTILNMKRKEYNRTDGIIAKSYICKLKTNDFNYSSVHISLYHSLKYSYKSFQTHFVIRSLKHQHSSV